MDIKKSHLNVLHECELFRNCEDDEIQSILNYFKLVQINAGELIVQADQVNQKLYVILDGKIRVHIPSDNLNPITTLTGGQCIGEISIIDKQKTSTNIIADTAATLLVISDQNIWTVLEEHPVIAVNMLKLVATRLRHGNSMFSKIKALMGQYEQSVMIDPLTNLYNRRWLNRMLPRFIERSLTDHLPLAAIMLDIDYFKQYNDNHGHLAGDNALRLVSQVIIQNIRPEDFVTRYGGEEFFLLLPNQEQTATVQIAERLRTAISQISMDTPMQAQAGLTASIGISYLQSGDTPETLICRADKALYLAKESGRDQIQVNDACLTV